MTSAGPEILDDAFWEELQNYLSQSEQGVAQEDITLSTSVQDEKSSSSIDGVPPSAILPNTTKLKVKSSITSNSKKRKVVRKRKQNKNEKILTEKEKKRRLANIKSAQQSRERFKEKLDGLEQKVDTLSKDKALLEEQLVTLEVEQKTLLEIYKGHIDIFKFMPFEILPLLEGHLDTLISLSNDPKKEEACINVKKKLGL